MTRRILLATAVLAFVFAAAAVAADISGNWTGTLNLGGDQILLNYTFKQDGEKLTGTIVTPQGDSLEMLDGKIVAEKLSFSVKTDAGNGLQKFLCEGTVKSADEVVLTTRTEDGNVFGEGPVTLKRTK
jgi:opacity protein-like surface antigen